MQMARINSWKYSGDYYESKKHSPPITAFPNTTKAKKNVQQPILALTKLPFRATSSGTTTTNQQLRPQLFLFLLLLQVSHAKIRLDSQGKPNRHVEKDGETREETATPVLTRPNIYPYSPIKLASKRVDGHLHFSSSTSTQHPFATKAG